MDDSPEPVLIYITVPGREVGLSLGRLLVEQGLAACANLVDNVTSIYSWQGEIQQDAECILLANTISSRTSQVVDLIRENHPYDLPAVLFIPISDGHQAFLDWIKTTVR